GGRGGGNEQGDVVAKRGDAPPATLQAGADDLVGVAAVNLGAGRAAVGAAVATRGVDSPVGHVLGGVGGDPLPGPVVDVDVAVEADRVPTPCRRSDMVQPLVVVRGGGAGHDGRGIRRPFAGTGRRGTGDGFGGLRPGPVPV